MKIFRPKLQNLMSLIKDAVKSGRYIISNHAYQRLRDRQVSVPQLEHVLSKGFHEEKKDKFDFKYNSWNYSICGFTPERRKVRIIVSFEEMDLVIVTVINLDN